MMINYSVVSVMFSLVNPPSSTSAWSIINAADALCFTGGHSHVLSLLHIILIRPDSIKPQWKKKAEWETEGDTWKAGSARCKEYLQPDCPPDIISAPLPMPGHLIY